MHDSGPVGAAWLFVTVALILVAAASFAAGYYRRSSRSAAPSAPAQASSSLWTDRLADDPRPALLLATGDGHPRVLEAANAAGLKLLGVGADAIGRPWADLEPRVPAALRTLLADPAAPPPQWWRLDSGDGHQCLLLGSDEATTASDEAALAYTVTHDLRSPIRVVEGFTRIVKEDYGRQLDRVGNDHLDRVLAASARMNLMIDAVLAQARLAAQPLARQAVDLTQLAHFVVDDLRRQAPERHAEVRVEPGLTARGDPTLLRQVLENLIGNAWKYSAQASPARIEFAAVVHQGRAGFVVRDNGAGFDIQLAKGLFGLFQRMHSAKDFPGTGVGLASVKRIVQRHGGEVWAESAPGRGSSFYFTLR